MQHQHNSFTMSQCVRENRPKNLPRFVFPPFVVQEYDHSWSLPKALWSDQRFGRFVILRIIKITFAFCNVLLEKAGEATGIWWHLSGFEGALQVHINAENPRQQPVLVPVEDILHWRAAAVDPGGKEAGGAGFGWERPVMVQLQVAEKPIKKGLQKKTQIISNTYTFRIKSYEKMMTKRWAEGCRFFFSNEEWAKANMQLKLLSN